MNYNKRRRFGSEWQRSVSVCVFRSVAVLFDFIPHDENRGTLNSPLSFRSSDVEDKWIVRFVIFSIRFMGDLDINSWVLKKYIYIDGSQ